MDPAVIQLGISRAVFTALARLIGIFMLATGAATLLPSIENYLRWNTIASGRQVTQLSLILENFSLAPTPYLVLGLILLARGRWLSRKFIPRSVLTSCPACGYHSGMDDPECCAECGEPMTVGDAGSPAPQQQPDGDQVGP